MDNLPRALVVAAMIFGGALLVHGLYPADRFTIVPAANGGSYRLDRLTGGVLFCDASFCRALPLAVPVAVAPGKPAPGRAPAGGAATGT